MELGVDGFRVDAIASLWENNYDMDEPLMEGPDAKEVK